MNEGKAAMGEMFNSCKCGRYGFVNRYFSCLLMLFQTIIQYQVMQKTKLITKPFQHDRKSTQQPDQQPQTDPSNNAPPIQLEIFPIFSPTYTPLEETYSLEDFIKNLQSEQMMYEGYFDQYDNGNSQEMNRRPIDQINNQYLQKIGPLDHQEERPHPKIIFDEQMSVKYYCENDAPENIAKYQEYAYPIDKNHTQSEEVFQMI